MSRIVFSVALLSATCRITTPANAAPIEWDSGDLGDNVIQNAGEFELFPSLVSPSSSSPAELRVKYGLWDSPKVLVDVFVNDIKIGDILANDGYSFPGPHFADLDVTGLLLDGVNTVKFTGNSVNDGAYVVGQVWITYTETDLPRNWRLYLD